MALTPALFVSHGAPSLILEKDETTQFFTELSTTLPPLSGIICISAHWETPQPLITFNPLQTTIYDFYSNPKSVARFNPPKSPLKRGTLRFYFAPIK